LIFALKTPSAEIWPVRSSAPASLDRPILLEGDAARSEICLPKNPAMVLTSLVILCAHRVRSAARDRITVLAVVDLSSRRILAGWYPRRAGDDRSAHEPDLFQLGYAFEQLTRWRRPPASTPPF
jgi:hypothetical protein